MPPFNIAAAQVPCVRGDVARNVAVHVEAIEAAAERGVSVVVFPELSLIGYELDLAVDLAMTATDRRLEPLIELSSRHQIDLVIGAPLQSGEPKPFLGAIVIHADGATETYGKMHLGGSEPDYVTPGEQPLAIKANGQTIGLAICADASRETHPQHYSERGAGIYAAGVLLTAEWYATDAPRLAAHAANHRMLVVMANQAASTGTYKSVGKSAIWSPDGSLIAQSANAGSALIIATLDAAGWRGEVVDDSIFRRMTL